MPRDIEINGKQLVMQVLQDAAGNYSVSGYAGRMTDSFGLIYLGLDKTDPEYARQSAASNRAIGQITEQDAFQRAYDATVAVMQRLGDGSDFDIKDVSDEVLAEVCKLWFDVPDGRYVKASGSYLPFAPGSCPGQFGPPSGFIFQPQPNCILGYLGKADGQLLKREVAKFVAAQRQSGNAPNGVLSRALFAAFTPAEDDLLTRTLIGVMIGLLPTVQGNLLAVMEGWQDGGQYNTLRQQFTSNPEPDLYTRAVAVIRPGLISAMQAAPVPPAIWRTALRNHRLGDIDVEAGDRLFINLDSATKEDLAAGIADPYPIFGGNRRQNPHPTHACPGFQAGMGVLLGIVAGTMGASAPRSSFTVTRTRAVMHPRR